MTSIPKEPLNKDSSKRNNILLSSTNHQINKNNSSNTNKIPPLSSNLGKSNQIISKDIRLNKLNVNSSLNIPTANNATNASLNDQNPPQKKDHNDYFDNEILYQDEEENDPIFKEFTMINDRRNKAIDDLKNISERIKINNQKIEEIKKNLTDLKEEKKQKQAEIINLLSNKETIEEIYKNQIYSLNISPNTESGDSSTGAGTGKGSTYYRNKNSTINRKNDNTTNRYNNNRNNNNQSNGQPDPDEDNFKVTLNDIKESEQKRYVEQVLNMFEDIFKKRDEKLNSLIANLIKNSYELFVNNINEENYNEKNNDIIITNFFGKVSLFISNHSLGKYSENKINLFLRYLLKINAINARLTSYIKFVNKKYKERKKELTDMINFLEKKNINLAEKNNRIETNMKEYDDKLEFFGKNDVFDLEQKSDNSDEGLYDNYNKDEKIFSNKNKKKIVKNRNKNNLKNIDNEDQLSHDVVIEYEDGIDQNVEINYEDDLANDYDYEKENEMIKQGLNPYNNEDNKFNAKKNSVLNNQRNNKNKQIIVKDNDESDKYLNEFLKDDDKKDKNNSNSNTDKNNNNEPQKTKRIFYSNPENANINLNQSYCKMSSNVVSINETTMLKSEVIDVNKLNPKELEHYKRVQRIMNSGPKVIGIFGVNNYNPENSIYSIKLDNNNNKDNVLSPNKTEANVPTSNNKINKTIRIGSRQNHNFVSVINKTKMVPIKKKSTKDKTVKTNEKSKPNRESDDGIIRVINLEDNFLSELKDDDKIEENEKNNESTSNITNNNNLSKSNKNNSNENIENDENPKSSTNGDNNKNEVQGYFLNIINKNKDNENEKENILKNDKIEKLNSESSDNNEFFSTSSKKTLKVTKSREVNINEIKNSKIGIITKKHPKNLIPNNDSRKGKVNNVENTIPRHKSNNSLNKNINHKNISNISITGNNSINDSSAKRSHSISVNMQNKKDEGKNKQFTSKIIVSSNIPNSSTYRKINIPTSKISN